jgi:hypothetical protein
MDALADLFAAVCRRPMVFVGGPPAAYGYVGDNAVNYNILTRKVQAIFESRGCTTDDGIAFLGDKPQPDQLHIHAEYLQPCALHLVQSALAAHRCEERRTRLISAAINKGYKFEDPDDMRKKSNEVRYWISTDQLAVEDIAKYAQFVDVEVDEKPLQAAGELTDSGKEDVTERMGKTQRQYRSLRVEDETKVPDPDDEVAEGLEQYYSSLCHGPTISRVASACPRCEGTGREPGWADFEAELKEEFEKPELMPPPEIAPAGP